MQPTARIKITKDMVVIMGKASETCGTRHFGIYFFPRL